MGTTIETPTASQMIEQARAKYPTTRFAVSRLGGSIGFWSEQVGRWVCCSMLVGGIGWVQCSSNTVDPSDWIEAA